MKKRRENDAKMAPTSVQKARKIDTKIDQKNHAFKNLLLKGFPWIFGSKTEANWYQNGIKNRYEVKKAREQKVRIFPIEF